MRVFVNDMEIDEAVFFEALSIVWRNKNTQKLNEEPLEPEEYDVVRDHIFQGWE